MAARRVKRAEDGKNKSLRGAKRGESRVSNACQACKKRKTKCTGQPGPCSACRSNASFCHFSLKLDSRRKESYKPSAVQERQQFFLNGILCMLRHSDFADIKKLLYLIRNQTPPESLAKCLEDNFVLLQGKGILPPIDFDESDILSIGLQALLSHRQSTATSTIGTEKSDDDHDGTRTLSEDLTSGRRSAHGTEARNAKTSEELLAASSENWDSLHDLPEQREFTAMQHSWLGYQNYNVGSGGGIDQRTEESDLHAYFNTCELLPTPSDTSMSSTATERNSPNTDTMMRSTAASIPTWVSFNETTPKAPTTNTLARNHLDPPPVPAIQPPSDKSNTHPLASDSLATPDLSRFDSQKKTITIAENPHPSPRLSMIAQFEQATKRIEAAAKTANPQFSHNSQRSWRLPNHNQANSSASEEIFDFSGYYEGPQASSLSSFHPFNAGISIRTLFP